MKLHSLRPAKGAVKKNTRVGRGQGSGGGGTAKRGHKGASSRSGYSRKLGFEGGQMPLQRRLPKFGFNNINRVAYKAINLYVIQELIDKTGAKDINLGFLYNRGLTSKSDLVKILGDGEIKSAVNIKVNAFSKSAIAAIEKAGGTAVVDASFDPESGKDVKVVKAEKTGAKSKAKVEKSAPKAEKSASKEEKSTTKAAPKAENTEAKEAKKAAPAAKKIASEEKPAKAKAEPKAAAPAKKGTKKDGDDLTKVEGIGPKIASLLNADGIITFKDLSNTKVTDLEAILEKAGPRYNIHNPSTWPQQAGLAAEGKWDELKDLQDKLSGGRPE